jgi:hypothetical protein
MVMYGHIIVIVAVLSIVGCLAAFLSLPPPPSKFQWHSCSFDSQKCLQMLPNAQGLSDKILQH